MTENGSLADWLTKLGISKELNNADILSGVTVNAALTKMLQNYTIRLPLTNTASVRISNWNAVINELEQIGVSVGQQQKSKILNGDDKIVYNILYQLKNHYDKTKQEVQVDINKIDSRGDPKSSKSLLELFILIIVKYYGFSVKQAVALLSNDSKYLAHILAKGFKESAKPVEGMLTELIRLLPQINTFCKNKQNQTFFLKSIKPGLISKFITISEITLQLLTQFTKNLPDRLDVVKNDLMPTFVLSLRRHPCQIGAIAHTLTQILGYNKNILSFFMHTASPNETSLFMLQLLNQAESSNQLQQIFHMFQFQQFLQKQRENLKISDLFANSGTCILKVIQISDSNIMQNGDFFSKLLDNLASLSLSKRGDQIIFSNLLFSFLHTFGQKKNSIAAQFLKLGVDKYKSCLNEEESQNYLHNFLNIINIFPSIPSTSIVDAILFRYQTSTGSIGQPQFAIIEHSIVQMDEKGALRTYNIITKIFMEEVGSAYTISNILTAIIKNFESNIIFDLNIKFGKVCLAVYYANLRKLNYSKSLVEGIVKLDLTNAFYKAKNKQIQQLLTNMILVGDQKLNKALQPMICYSFIHSELKNKEESEGIKQVMLLFGDEEDLRKLYQNDAKLMLEEGKNEGRKKVQQKDKNENNKYKEGEVKNRVSSDASLLVKKKDYLLSNPPKVSYDAQKGLEKYTKVFKEKMVKLSLEQEKKLVEDQKQEELRRRFTLKIMEKGIKIAKQMSVNCLYQFNSKQKQQQRDNVNDISYLPFYDPNTEEDRDVKAIQYLVKKYSKLFKVYYNHYGGKLRPNTIRLFQDISQTANLMQSANVWKLLRDHDLDLFITVRELQFTVQKINTNLKKQYKDSSLLDYEVFENFLVQASLIMFSRAPKDMRTHPISDMLLQVVHKLKEKAHLNKIDQKLFEETENYQSNKFEHVKELNQKLIENPDYILPQGYKKITIKKISFQYKTNIQSQSQISESYQQVYDLLDELLFQKFHFHIVQPYSNTIIEATARPLLYQTNFDSSIKQRSFSSALPKTSKVSSTVKEEQQGPKGEEESQFNDLKTPSQKVSNQYLKDKRLKEEEKQRKQEQEQKRREQRDKQLKGLLEKYRERQQEIEKEKQQKKKQEQQKQENQKRKRQKYQEEVKKKVQEFAKKKQAQKAKQEEQLRKKKEEENKKEERMKQEIEKKKKMVEQSKMKKKQSYQQRLEQEKIEKERIQAQNKAKMEQKKQRNRILLQQYKERKQKGEPEKAKSKQMQFQQEVKQKIKTKSIDSKLVQQQKQSVQGKIKQQISEVKIEQLDNN